MAYLLDSDVFIQARNLHYGFDFCPAFWDWLEWAHRRDPRGALVVDQEAQDPRRLHRRRREGRDAVPDAPSRAGSVRPWSGCIDVIDFTTWIHSGASVG